MQKIPDGVKVTVLMVLGVVLTAFFNPFLVWGSVIAMGAAFMLLGAPLWLLLFLLGWSLTSFVFTSIFENPLLNRADDLMILLMFMVFVGRIALKRMPSVPYIKTYLALVFLTGFSKVLNGSPVSNWGLFLLAYISPYLLFCLVYSTNRPKVIDRVLKLVLVVYGAGILLNIGWFLRINPIYNMHLGTGDFAKGTLGACDLVSYFSIFIIFLLVSLYRNTGIRKQRVGYALLIGVSLVQFYMTFTNHAYLYFAALFPVYLVISRQKLRSYVAAMVVLTVLILAAMFAGNYKADQRGATGLAGIANAKTLDDRWRKFLREPKVEVYDRVIWNGRQEGVLEWFIGHGPGSGIGTVARTRPSPYSFKILGDIYLTQSGRDSMQGSSITQSPFSGPTSLWSEVGLIGTFLFYGLVILPMWKVFKRIRVGFYEKGTAQLVIAEGFLVYGVLFFMINLLKDFWSVDLFTFLLWALAGLALRKPFGEQTASAAEHKTSATKVGS